MLALAMPALFTLSAQEPVMPFVVGAWGQGDALIPFADFDGQSWRTSWPEPVEEPADRPLQQIPASWWGRSHFQPTWELIQPDGRRLSVQITGTSPARLGSSCSGNLGLTTDAPSSFPYGAALGISRSGVVEPVVTLTSNAAEWRTLSAFLPDIYQRHEAAAWNEAPESFRPDMTAPLSEPRLEAAFIFRDEAAEFAYIESSREFARRPGQLGEDASFITVWLWRRSSTMPFELATVQPGRIDPDGKGTRRLLPLGVVRNGAERFWLAFLSGYGYTGLTVLDVRRDGVRQLLLVDYPGC